MTKIIIAIGALVLIFSVLLFIIVSRLTSGVPRGRSGGSDNGGSSSDTTAGTGWMGGSSDNGCDAGGGFGGDSGGGCDGGGGGD